MCFHRQNVLTRVLHRSVELAANSGRSQHDEIASTKSMPIFRCGFSTVAGHSSNLSKLESVSIAASSFYFRPCSGDIPEVEISSSTSPALAYEPTEWRSPLEFSKDCNASTAHLPTGLADSRIHYLNAIRLGRHCIISMYLITMECARNANRKLTGE